MWPYVEYTLGFLLSSQRGRDAKLFHKGPAFANLIEPSLKVTSPECGPSNSTMVDKHGKDSGNQFPTISWEPPTTDTKVEEYMLIVEDPDAPLPNPIAHGVYYAIPADTRIVDASSLEPVGLKGANDLKGGFKFGQNRGGTIYGGPRPVLGHGPHRYFYQVIALSEKVDQKGFAAAKPTREELAKAIEGKILAWGVWIGVFERKLSQNSRIYMRILLAITRSYATASTRTFRLPSTKKAPLSLDHFLLRQRAISLYRTIIRACHKMPPPTREEMKKYAREEFERHKAVEDVRKIRYLLSTGKTEFERLGKQVSGMG